MDAACAMCGRSRDAHNRHVRFRLPDPVLAAPLRERTRGTWMSHDDAESSVMMQVPEVGHFVRVLLPITLIGGDTLTFGIWLGVAPEDFHRAFAQWWAPTYPDLVLEGHIANDVQPWGLLARPGCAVVRNPQATPYLARSTDSLTEQVLTRHWPHDEVLDALPETLR
ncbi:MAG TPA: DUF2199 domain-containing protein [Jatrophihabitans sp.]